MSAPREWSRQDILSVLPHREPFLFVDRVLRLQPDRVIVTERYIREDEVWCAGHFPGNPIMPGVLVTDALAQSCGLLWGLSKKVRDGEDDDGVPRVFFLAAANMKYVSPALPAQTLRMTAHADRVFGTLYSYTVEAVVDKRAVVKGSLTLAMVQGTA